MKKLLFLLLLLPLGFLVSCSDDDSIPSVDITVTFDNVATNGQTIYAVQGQDFSVQSITVVPTNGKTAAIAGVSYFLDRIGIGSTLVEPFTVTFNASNLPVGNHLLQMDFDVLQVDKSIFQAQLSNVVTIVADESELPDGATLGTHSETYRISPD